MRASSALAGLLLGTAAILACSTFASSDDAPGVVADGGADGASQDGASQDGGAQACGASAEIDASPTADCNADGLPVDLLSSDGNCGRCGRACGGEGCASGLCAMQTFETGSAMTLATSTTEVFWGGEGFEAPVRRKAFAGGAAVTITRSQAYSGVSALLVEGSRAYVNTQAEIYWVPSDATSEAPKTAISPNNNTRGGLAADDTHLYWARYNVIESWPKDGSGPPSDISSANADNAAVTGIVSDASTLFWTMLGAATDGGAPNHKLYQRTKNGDVVVRAQQLGEPRGIALDAAYVYWGDWDGGRILRAQRGQASAPETVVQLSDYRFVRSIAVDATHVYWIGKRSGAADYQGRLARAPLCGGTVETLALHNAMTDAVALQDTHVYFSALDGVRRVRR